MHFRALKRTPVIVSCWPSTDMSSSNCLLPLQASQFVLDLSLADAAKSRDRS